MTSIKDIHKLAYEGVSEWQYYLGNLYSKGDNKLGIKKDMLESMKWFKFAAKRNHPGGLNKYGMYNYKIGNHKTAYKCFRKSFELNDTCGRYNYCYFILNHPEFVKMNFIPAILEEFKSFKNKISFLKTKNDIMSNIDSFITSLQLVKLKNS